MTRRNLVLIVLTTVWCTLFVAACQTPREKVKYEHRPRNTVFIHSEVLPKMQLGENEKQAFLLWERTMDQSLHVLLLAPDAVMTERYHERHGVTFLCVSGSAIVEVEERRYFLEPPAAVVVPRLYAYKIIPHKTEKPFAAIAVFSPPFDGRDTVLTEMQETEEKPEDPKEETGEKNENGEEE